MAEIKEVPDENQADSEKSLNSRKNRGPQINGHQERMHIFKRKKALCIASSTKDPVSLLQPKKELSLLEKFNSELWNGMTTQSTQFNKVYTQNGVEPTFEADKKN